MKYKCIKELKSEKGTVWAKEGESYTITKDGAFYLLGEETNNKIIMSKKALEGYFDDIGAGLVSSNAFKDKKVKTILQLEKLLNVVKKAEFGSNNYALITRIHDEIQGAIGYVE